MFRLPLIINTIKENLHYHIAVFLLNVDDWFCLVTCDETTFDMDYKTFWNGALNLDICSYNKFLDE